MPRVICTLPNFSGEVNGIAFTLDRDEWISSEVDAETAVTLASIPGYRLVVPPAATPLIAPADRAPDTAPLTAGDATTVASDPAALDGRRRRRPATPPATPPA